MGRPRFGFGVSHREEGLGGGAAGFGGLPFQAGELEAQRHPLLVELAVTAIRGQFLLDLGDEVGTDVLVFVLHAVGVTQLVVRALFEFGLLVAPRQAPGTHRAQVGKLALDGRDLCLDSLLS